MSDFHSNILTLNNSLGLKKPNMLYRFRFTSLISPYLLPNLRLHNITSEPSTTNKSTILLKQSYLLFTWFYYLKESRMRSFGRVSSVIKFAFLPTRRTAYTLTKAPMAHKTNSKEQYVFRVFHFKASFKSYFSRDSAPTSLDNSARLLILTKQLFPVFETNLLLLKNYNIQISFCDALFFNYHALLTPSKRPGRG